MISVEEYQIAIEQHRSDLLLESLNPIERKELLLAYATKCSSDNIDAMIKHHNKMMAIHLNLI